MSVLTKLKDLIVAQFSAAEVTELETLSKKIEVKLKEITTKDGKKLSIEGDVPAEKMAVTDNSSGTPLPAGDGDYTMEDGTMFTVVGGIISSVKPVVTETEEQIAARKAAEVAVPQLAQMSLQMAAQKESFDKVLLELRKENIELKKAIQLNSKALTEILNTPVNNVGKKAVVTPDFSKMSATDERAWHRDNA